MNPLPVSPDIRYCDAHMHLWDPDLQVALAINPPGPDAPEIAAQVVNGTHPDDWALMQGLSTPSGTRLIRAYGVHPWKVDDLPSDWEQKLRERLQCGAGSVGEIGLDNWIEPRNERRQMEIFEIQLGLAHEFNLVPSIHCLRAWGLLIDALKRGPTLNRGFLVHGFGGSVEILHQLLDLGGHASFSAYAAHPGRKRMRDAARVCPLDRLLVETDAPDMVPPEENCRFPLHDWSGKRLHHPFEIETAYSFLAEWRGEDLRAMAAQVEQNFQRLFL